MKLNSPAGMPLRAIALPLEGDDVGDIGGEVTVLIALGLGGTGPAPVLPALVPVPLLAVKFVFCNTAGGVYVLFA